MMEIREIDSMYEKEISWLKEAKSSSCDGVDCIYHVEGEDCGGICIKALDAAIVALAVQLIVLIVLSSTEILHPKKTS